MCMEKLYIDWKYIILIARNGHFILILQIHSKISRTDFTFFMHFPPKKYQEMKE